MPNRRYNTIEAIEQYKEMLGVSNVTNTRLYNIWKLMKRRCYNPKCKEFKNYGGRGISICEEWCNSFPLFAEWALLNRYAENLCIERVENNEGYYPENCKWTTAKEQGSNKRNNVLVKIGNMVKTLAEWSRATKLPYSTLKYRFEHGVSGEELLKGGENIAVFTFKN